METRSNFKVMSRLIGMVKPLTGHMILAIVMGVLGNLCAIAIPVIGSVLMVRMVYYSDWMPGSDVMLDWGVISESVRESIYPKHSLSMMLLLLVVVAVLRGVLHYAEQNRNHYIAFRLLALIRDRVFGALRRLAPAKLDGKDKGDLIAVLTSDIELLEVFYAHTISPICIAVIVSIVMVIWLGHFHILLGVYGFLAYLIVGLVIPLIFAKRSRKYGEDFRRQFGEMDAYVLDQIRGVDESIQYGYGKDILREIHRRTDELSEQDGLLKGEGGTNSAITTGVILLLDLGILALSLYLHNQPIPGDAFYLNEAVIPVVSLMSSFGPVIALANLGTGLQSTFAAGNRVLDIIDEEPLITDITDGRDITFEGAACDEVTFAYDKDRVKEAPVLDHYSLEIPKHHIVGIVGKSGSGKSTLLKLLMRYFHVDQGEVRISDTNIEEINTKNLRDQESFVTQETVLFHDSIEQNLLIANPDATHEQIVEACKKASIHDFIMTLPQGYDTKVGELGDTLSGGEKQRLGIARAFLHDAPCILLDEPTSNLDSLNEAIILKSLQDYRSDKTIVLVSHRKSTMCIADDVVTVHAS